MPKKRDIPHPRGLLTSEEAATFLGVTRSTIKRWVDKGALKPQERRPSTTSRRKGAMYFSREYLEQMLQEWTEAGVRPEDATTGQD